uniref:Uncharacterized protein n=1 Tax=Graphocephala atropunctata TaxID=36148 RepID=A0A1B6MQB0_9HEMI
MPSIFNHENACWGVKRSICNVFQYDLGEELQTSKSNEFSNAPNSNNLASTLNSVQYSVSANGYYGYQPHSIIQNHTNADNAMDVEENDISLNVPGENHCLSGRISFTSSANYQNVRRKRPMNDSSMEITKRSRQEGATVPEMTKTQESSQDFPRKEYFSHPKCLMGHFM